MENYKIQKSLARMSLQARLEGRYALSEILEDALMIASQETEEQGVCVIIHPSFNPFSPESQN